MEKVDWKVDGMTCSNCALTISKYLNEEGMANVKVNPLDGHVSFDNPGTKDDVLKKGIGNLGYAVVDERQVSSQKKEGQKFSFKNLLNTNKKRFLFCLPFTLVLMLHMLERWVHIPWLMNPWVQFALCLPVFWVGMAYFGKSAIKSIRNGIPNMNVLIALGALAAFVYSLTGAVLNLGEDYLFFETSASIITIVFMGNFLEEASVQSTQKAVKALAKSQKVMANMIAFDDQHREQIFPIENTALRTGDLILIRNGETVPMDCKILWGECYVNEAIITGESIPVSKTKRDHLIGGSVLDSGLVKAQVTAVGESTVLSGILKMVQDAQGEKPPMQKMADRISAVFVPLVLGIAVLTFGINYFFTDAGAGGSLMRSIAVLVIACPCAMGLATPAAIAVGLGRGARSGILYRNASVLESFREIQQVVFDKTGTLTTGKFEIRNMHTTLEETAFKQIIASLEKYSNHPIGKSIAGAWQQHATIHWQQVEEIKGKGMRGTHRDGSVYEAGSAAFSNKQPYDQPHEVYLFKNGEPVGWIDIADEPRPEAKSVINWLKKKGIHTIMLSGDTKAKTEAMAQRLGIDEVIAEKTPGEKLEVIAAMTKEKPTAMVGDGINDAPALAKATIGISLSDATQIAMQSADVLLVNKGLTMLPQSLGLGKHTYLTIKQNLFWAFFYNILAIPIAAIGLLTPTFAALAMGMSDVVLALNSGRLFVKKVI